MAESDSDRTRIAKLFPLPLTPFEQYMFSDDRPSSPMLFYLRATLEGRIDVDRFCEAIRIAVRRHPLLSARVEVRGNRCEWVFDDRFEPRIVVHNSSSAGSVVANPTGRVDPDTMSRRPSDVTWLTNERIDLTKEPGVRFWVNVGDSQSTFLAQCHHAAVDGSGTRRLFVDIFTAYARMFGGDKVPDWDDIEYERLLDRNQFHPGKTDESAENLSVWTRLLYAYRFHTWGPHPVSPMRLEAGHNRSQAQQEPSRPPSDWDAQPHFRTFIFDRETSNRIRSKSRESKLPVNDVALGLLMQTLATWNQTHARKVLPPRIRILMPTDLRDRDDDVLTAANRMSYSFLSRDADQCANWDSLMSSIQGETRYIKQVRLGLDFLNGLNLAYRFPAVVRGLMEWQRCLATAVLTNLGDPTRRFRRRFPDHGGYIAIGNVRMTELVGVPPLRPLTHAGFSMVVCGGRLALSICGANEVLGGHGTKQLLNDYVDAWEQWLN